MCAYQHVFTIIFYVVTFKLYRKKNDTITNAFIFTFVIYACVSTHTRTDSARVLGSFACWKSSRCFLVYLSKPLLVLLKMSRLSHLSGIFQESVFDFWEFDSNVLQWNSWIYRSSLWPSLAQLFSLPLYFSHLPLQPPRGICWHMLLIVCHFSFPFFFPLSLSWPSSTSLSSVLLIFFLWNVSETVILLIRFSNFRISLWFLPSNLCLHIDGFYLLNYRLPSFCLFLFCTYFLCLLLK